MVDIFDEVEEDLRAERAEKLLKRYAPLIVAVAVAIVAGAAGWQGWNWWQSKQDAAAASRYVAAQTAADQAAPGSAATAQVDTLARIAAASPEGYKTLARLKAAGLKADAGDLAGAVALWDQVAGDSSADGLLRDLATLNAATREIGQGDPARLQARLEPIAQFGNPWSPLAREQLAILDLAQGKLDDARTKLKALSTDFTVPQGVRARTAALLAGLG